MKSLDQKALFPDAAFILMIVLHSIKIYCELVHLVFYLASHVLMEAVLVL